MLLKSLLGKKISSPSKDITFNSNKYGKLLLDNNCIKPGNNQSVFFNLSHTNGMVACAISENVDIGIDVENTTKNYLEMMRSVFTPREINVVEDQTTLPQKIKKFFLIWTRKESVMKAKGLGFNLPPLSFSVPILEGLDKNSEFIFKSFTPTKEHLISIAVFNCKEVNNIFEIHNVSFDDLRLMNQKNSINL